MLRRARRIPAARAATYTVDTSNGSTGNDCVTVNGTNYLEFALDLTEPDNNINDNLHIWMKFSGTSSGTAEELVIDQLHGPTWDDLVPEPSTLWGGAGCAALVASVDTPPPRGFRARWFLVAPSP